MRQKLPLSIHTQRSLLEKNSKKTITEPKNKFLRQTLEGSILSRLIHVPSDPNHVQEKKIIENKEKSGCGLMSNKAKYTFKKNYSLSIAKECAKCWEHHIE